MCIGNWPHADWTSTRSYWDTEVSSKLGIQSPHCTTGLRDSHDHCWPSWTVVVLLEKLTKLIFGRELRKSLLKKDLFLKTVIQKSEVSGFNRWYWIIICLLNIGLIGIYRYFKKVKQYWLNVLMRVYSLAFNTFFVNFYILLLLSFCYRT